MADDHLVPRALARRLVAATKGLPIVFLTGPRQSGKTTLCRHTFPKAPYVSLEDPDTREFAVTDPRAFLKQFETSRLSILDEAQRVPELFSYLQGIVDQNPNRRFLLTGSQQFLLDEHISQSLAGRTAVLELLPFAMAEISQSRTQGERPAARDRDLSLTEGFYPRVRVGRLRARDWMPSYVRTYLERDVRHVINVQDLEAFARFLRLAAGRSGQILNLSSLGSDLGLSHATMARWISVLEASGIVFLLRPFHANLNRRLIKSPKLYFLDTGLCCYLLGIRNPTELRGHPLHGAIFETYVVAEHVKWFTNRGEKPRLSFFRDVTGREVDLVREDGTRPLPIEIKLTETIRNDAFAGLKDFQRFASVRKSVLVHGGELSQQRTGCQIRPWFAPVED